MAISAVLVGARGVGGGNTATTTAGTTAASGSTFAVCVSWDTTATSPTVTDSKGNTYTAQGTPQIDNYGGQIQWFVCQNGTGGASHTATFTTTGSSYPVIHLIEVTGAAAASLDQIAQGLDLTQPYTLTSPTLSQADEVVLCGVAEQSTSATYTSSNFTVLSQETDIASYWTSAVGSLVVASTAAVTPSWSRSNQYAALALVTFKQAAVVVTQDFAASNRNRPGRGPYSKGLYFRPVGETARPAATLNSYTLTADAGAYALSGQAAALRASRKLASAQGAYALTGQAAALKRGLTIIAAQGAYALTGQAAALKFGHLIVAAQGAYALTGQAAALRRGYTAVAGQGAYSLTGQAAGLRASRLIAGQQGSYSLTGQSATLTYSTAYSLSAAQGSYALTGSAAALRATRILTAAQGAYTISGQSATLLYSTITVATICMGFHHQSESGTVQTGGSSIESDVSLSVSSGFPGTASYPVIGSGTLVTTGASAGTAQLRLRAEVADVVTAKAGFVLIVEKVS